jgi:hypothetical protein
MVKQVAILHEGKAGKSQDNWLLEALTKELAQENSALYFWERVQCFGMGGKSNFFDPFNNKYTNDLLPL